MMLNGNVCVCDSGTGRLQIFTKHGELLRVVEYLTENERKDSNGRAGFLFSRPTSVAASAEFLFVCHVFDLCSAENALVKIRISDWSIVERLMASHPSVNEQGWHLSAWDGAPIPPEEEGDDTDIMFEEWWDQPIDAVCAGSRLYVADLGANFGGGGTPGVHVIDTDTFDRVLSTFGDTNAQLGKPEAITHHDGLILVMDTCHGNYPCAQAVVVFTTNGDLLRTINVIDGPETMNLYPTSVCGMDVARGRLMVGCCKHAREHASTRLEEMKVHVLSLEGDKLQTLDLFDHAPLLPDENGNTWSAPRVGKFPAGSISFLCAAADRMYVGDHITHSLHILRFEDK